MFLCLFFDGCCLLLLKVLLIVFFRTLLVYTLFVVTTRVCLALSFLRLTSFQSFGGFSTKNVGEEKTNNGKFVQQENSCSFGNPFSSCFLFQLHFCQSLTKKILTKILSEMYDIFPPLLDSISDAVLKNKCLFLSFLVFTTQHVMHKHTSFSVLDFTVVIDFILERFWEERQLMFGMLLLWILSFMLSSLT